jgi:hypothetical protein
MEPWISVPSGIGSAVCGEPLGSGGSSMPFSMTAFCVEDAQPRSSAAKR